MEMWPARAPTTARESMRSPKEEMAAVTDRRYRRGRPSAGSPARTARNCQCTTLTMARFCGASLRQNLPLDALLAVWQYAATINECERKPILPHPRSVQEGAGRQEGNSHSVASLIETGLLTLNL